MTAGALLGGHVRVGFENNLALPNGERAASNAELVAAVVQALSDLGFAGCTADGLRAETESLLG